MKKSFLALVSLLSITACQSIEGQYAPACEAYAGSRIQLGGGDYLWERFTDVRRLDANGQPADPFPDFPKRGSYVRSGQALSLNDAEGSQIGEFFLHERNDVPYMLDAEQHASVEAGGEFPECALMLQPTG